MALTKPKRKDLMVLFEKLLKGAERNICYHEETHRGGVQHLIAKEVLKEIYL